MILQSKKSSTCVPRCRTMAVRRRHSVSSVRPPTASGTQLGQLKLTMFGPHVPTGADGFGTRGMGAHHPVGPNTLLAGQLLRASSCPLTPWTNPAWPACRAEIRKPTRRTVQQHTPTFLCSTKYHGPIHSAPRGPVRKVICHAGMHVIREGKIIPVGLADA